MDRHPVLFRYARSSAGDRAGAGGCDAVSRAAWRRRGQFPVRDPGHARRGIDCAGATPYGEQLRGPVARTAKPARPARRERCVLGIDVGGTNTRADFFSQKSFAMQCLRTSGTHASRAGSQSLAQLAGLVRDVVEEGRASGLTARNVGIGIPELVGVDGRIESHCSLPWSAREVRSCLGAYGNVTIVSDVMAATLAEARMGAGRGQPAFLYVTPGPRLTPPPSLARQPHPAPPRPPLPFPTPPPLP